MKIEIPFNKWSIEKLCADQKTATTRNKIYGHIGDTFEVDLGSEIAEYRLLAVFPLKLCDVASCLYFIEGAESPEEFMKVWCDIHKKAGWTPDKIVYVHLFYME